MFPISAATGSGLKELVNRAAALAAEHVEAVQVVDEVRVYEPKAREEAKITRESDGTFVVHSKELVRLVAMTDFANEEALRRFQKLWTNFEIDEKLLARGIKDGDTVRISDMEFEYRR